MKLVLSLLILSVLSLSYWVGFSVPEVVVSEVQLTTRVSQPDAVKNEVMSVGQVVTPEYQ